MRFVYSERKQTGEPSEFLLKSPKSLDKGLERRWDISQCIGAREAT
jgi:hypothetical protein